MLIQEGLRDHVISGPGEETLDICSLHSNGERYILRTPLLVSDIVSFTLVWVPTRRLNSADWNVFSITPELNARNTTDMGNDNPTTHSAFLTLAMEEHTLSHAVHTLQLPLTYHISMMHATRTQHEGLYLTFSQSTTRPDLSSLFHSALHIQIHT